MSSPVTELSASYFDGLTSRPHPVTLRFHLAEGMLEVRGPQLELQVPRAEVTIESRLGKGPRFIRFAAGGRCEVTDNDALDQIVAHWKPNRGAAWLHRLETSWPHVIVAVVVMGLLGWAGIHFGLPWGARKIAFALPEGITQTLGEQTLTALDGAFFEPSNLTHERQLALQGEFKKFLAATKDTTPYRIEFRSAKKSLGANAIALPDGTIVITDELVLLAKDDQEIVGVLAHECGHIQNRHALRGVLQNSAIFVLVTLVTGDVSSARLSAARFQRT
jgi:hypothetical protein